MDLRALAQHILSGGKTNPQIQQAQQVANITPQGRLASTLQDYMTKRSNDIPLSNEIDTPEGQKKLESLVMGVVGGDVAPTGSIMAAQNILRSASVNPSNMITQPVSVNPPTGSNPDAMAPLVDIANRNSSYADFIRELAQKKVNLGKLNSLAQTQGFDDLAQFFKKAVRNRQPIPEFGSGIYHNINAGIEEAARIAAQGGLLSQ